MSGPDPVAALRLRLARLPERLRAEAADALQAIGLDVVEAAGRRLRLSGGPGPSAPGEAPHDPSGHIAASLATGPADPEGGTSVAAAHPAALALEYGTRTMAPRPFLRPAVEEARPAAVERCRRALARAAASAMEEP